LQSCAVVPSHNANSVNVKLLQNQPEINIGARRYIKDVPQDL